MLRNYLAAALRHLVRGRLYTFINITGLAVGFAAAILIGLFVRDELTFDRWLPGADSTYLLTAELSMPGRSEIISHFTPADYAKALALELQGVAKAVRLLPEAPSSVRRGSIESNEVIAWGDPELFELLRLPVIAGDLRTALQRPDGLVLTRALALKYFGRETPIGETLEIHREFPMTVTAVVEDLPSNTSLVRFGAIGSGLAPFSGLAVWDAKPHDGFFTNVAVFLRLRSGASAGAVRDSLSTFAAVHTAKVLSPNTHAVLDIQPLTALHFSNATIGYRAAPPGDRARVYAMAAVAAFILLIAWINFINLMTARAARRSVEVGVRKTAGAARRDLIIQFLGEAGLYAVIGMVLAVEIAATLMPSFNAFLDRTIVFAPVHDIPLALVLVATTIVSSVIGGFYPAVVLSAFRPAVVLKSSDRHSGGGVAFRQVLVALQFGILIAFIIATAVVYRQTMFAFHEGMRIDTDQIVVIRTRCQTPFHEEVATLPGVRGVSCFNRSALGGVASVAPVASRGMAVSGISQSPVDFDFFALWGLKPEAGRFFSRDHADAIPENSMSPNAVVINESAAHVLGYATPQEAIGQDATLLGRNRPGAPARPSEIIGVAPDFALDAIHAKVGPTVFYVDPREWTAVSVKLSGHDLPETLQAIDKLWARNGDPVPIMRTLQDAELADLYSDITQQAAMFSAFASVALLVACLGLVGLSALMAERRTKEIGVRKALGAGRRDILRLLAWEFGQPLLWANLLAWPVGYLVMTRWLEGFAYHVTLDPLLFPAAGLLALMIAALTVAGHALAVARAEPAKALRYE